MDDDDTQPLTVVDEPHDNEADGLTKCEDCKGSGWYVGATVREHCRACLGSGWV